MTVLFVVGMIVVLMVLMTYLSKSEKFKHVFANYGFENFSNVKYSGIGKNAPENAMDSCGARYDADFLEGDQDEFDDDAPKLWITPRDGAPPSSRRVGARR